MSGKPIYLDYAATTPVDARVAAVMNSCLTRSGTFGNPSSAHAYGRAARARVEAAREQAAALIGARCADLIWTSGATESNNLAIFGIARGAPGGQASRRGHIVTTQIEHPSVLDACRVLEQEGFAVTYLTPTAQGLITPAAVREALQPDTLLVSVMHANNEIGVVQDIAAIGQLCRQHGVPLHVDAAQSAGKIGVDVARLDVDLLGFTAHKLYGPKGIGALYITPAQRAALRPLLHGGGQERGLRAGTLPVHQIAGFGMACELARSELPQEGPRLERLREWLWRGLAALPQVRLHGHPANHLPGMLSVSFAGINGESLLAGLTELALSSGAACHSDSDAPSHVLRAIGCTAEQAQSTVRFSLGRFTRQADVDLAVAAVQRETRRLRALSP